MREIKFRVWQQMFGSWKMSYTPFLNESDGEPHDYSGQVNLNQEIQNEIDQGSKLMQYTGLKDKNQKEIYEGDILKNSRGFKEVVEILEENGYLGYDLHWSKEEIIGNIYENPELLKDNK